MKKFVTVVLIAMPFFLVVLIGVIGQVFLKTMDIPVERVVFVDFNGNEINVTGFTFNLETNQSMQLSVKVLPANASNRELQFSSSSEDVSVDRDGIVWAKSLSGMSKIVVSTMDGKKSASVNVAIDNRGPVREILVDESDKNIVLKTGNQFDIKTPTFLPLNTVQVGIQYESSDKSIADMQYNRIIAKKQGVVQIVIRSTINYDVFTTIHVEVLHNPINWGFDVQADVLMIDTEKFELKTEIDASIQNSNQEVKFTIISGPASIESNILTIALTMQVVELKAEYLGSDDNLYLLYLNVMRRV
ncbi:MAG: hypothetical protein LBU60_06800 [Clostridiales bacterium]|nr:hypothetical protein [Clostridiales bacterium]